MCGVLENGHSWKPDQCYSTYISSVEGSDGNAFGGAFHSDASSAWPSNPHDLMAVHLIHRLMNYHSEELSAI